jgi:ribose transport system ATP-binding protein
VSAFQPAIKFIELVGASKSFSGVRALTEVDLRLDAGEVNVLVGENGAGKSTIVKILSGVYQPDDGEIRLNGRPVKFASPVDAINRGIITIPQELMLVPEMTVTENLFLGKEHLKNGFLDKRAMIVKARETLKRLKQDFSPTAKVRHLGIAQQQMVEIGKALLNRCKILILDEPTAAITDKETQILFETIRSLKAQGVAILYISHRLEELFVIGDRTTILRNGHRVYSGPTASQSVGEMIQKMIGRELGNEFPSLPEPGGEVALRVETLSAPGKVEDISFSLRRREVVGFYGLIGAGRTELMRTLMGLERKTAGTIKVFGKETLIDSPRAAIASGLGMVPEDRKRQGLVLQRSVRENISLASVDKFAWFGFLNKIKEAELAGRFIRALSIKTDRQETKVHALSGGNQQKVVISKVLSTAPEIVIFDEPTRGIDVGAKQEVYRAMLDLLGEDKSIILVSSDIREVLGMSHRIVVMCGGRISAELPKESATQEIILTHSFPKADGTRHQS